VNIQGDLDVDQNLLVNGNSTIDGTLSVTGATVLAGTLNTQGDADFDANVLVNGNTTIDGTLSVTGATVLDSTLDVTGNGTFGNNVSVAGNMSGNSLTVDTGTINLNGVAYNVTNTQGAADTVLVNDGAGNLTWQSNAVANSSGSFMSLHPEYANVSYKGDGTANTGRLKTDVIANQNYYIWNTSKAAAQDYDIYVRVQVPENFASWAANGIQVQRNNAGVATVKADIIDTAGATQAGVPQAGVGVQSITPSGTFTPGGFMTVKLTVTATSAGDARLGYLNLNWITTTP
jgi:cytoskeletal protein CcmA (bactofilin family)